MAAHALANWAIPTVGTWKTTVVLTAVVAIRHVSLMNWLGQGKDKSATD